MIWVSDRSGLCCHFNKRWLNFRGRTLEEEKGNGWAEGVHPDDYDYCLETYFNAFNSRKEFEMQYRLKRWDGEYRWIFDTGLPLYKNGDFLGYIGSCTDVTPVKQAEELLAQQKVEKEMARLDRLNIIGEMAAALGHEIRNPLTTVRGFLQLFRQKQEFSGHVETIDLMIDELDRCDQIITGFLSLAKNKIANKVPSDLNNIINKAVILLEPIAKMTGHQLKTNLAAIPEILADEKEIRQLIINLVNNAFEAMETKGSVTISTFAEGEDVFLVVADEGKGIAEHILNNIGTPFISTKENGTGLGLAVCYKIVQRHDAQIAWETSSAGTTFRIGFKALK